MLKSILFCYNLFQINLERKATLSQFLRINNCLAIILSSLILESDSGGSDSGDSDSSDSEIKMIMIKSPFGKGKE
jgi:hypothetical protein